ncbi:MAG TPA: fumarylacetoacetase [Gemmatimonadaceae bacterium]
MNETHDPTLESWVESANAPDADFPVQNLPFGVFARHGQSEAPRVGIAIGDRILDVFAALEANVLGREAEDAGHACAEHSMNALMALGREHWSALRRAASRLLRRGGTPDGDRRLADRLLVPMVEARMLLPADVGDYTDFYASVHHATNVGSMFRPDAPLLPNYKHVPIGYHGRASSLVVGGTPVRRPLGQTVAGAATEPTFGPSRQLDYECEVGAFVGPGNPLGEPIAIGDAESRVFGLCLVNDWSARDIQRWEYQPLGPFLAKSFATTVSPWVVTLEALEPFRVAPPARAADDPRPLPYLRDEADARRGGVDIVLEVSLRTARMRESGLGFARVSRARFATMYWTLAQMLAHHASNGCNLRPGDLLASGTVSGPERDARGCLLELAWRGTEPVELPGGETRSFLEDGDEVVITGHCAREGARRIGFGRCEGIVLPAAP